MRKDRDCAMSFAVIIRNFSLNTGSLLNVLTLIGNRPFGVLPVPSVNGVQL